MVPESCVPADPALAGDGEEHREQDRRRRVDRHGNGHFRERQAVRQDPHVVERRDGDAHLPDLAPRDRVVRVVPHLCRQVEGDRETGLPLREEVPIAAIGLPGAPEAGVLAHRPVAAPVHVLRDAPRERVLPGGRLAVVRKHGDPGARLARNLRSSRFFRGTGLFGLGRHGDDSGTGGRLRPEVPPVRG